MPAHWWVELGLGLLLGRAVSRGMSRGGCELSKSLSTLSTDGCGCVPTMYFVGLRHTSTGDYSQWGPGLGANDLSKISSENLLR